MRDTDCELGPTRSHPGNRTSAADGATFADILMYSGSDVIT